MSTARSRSSCPAVIDFWSCLAENREPARKKPIRMTLPEKTAGMRAAGALRQGSRQKPRFLPAVHGVMSAEIARRPRAISAHLPGFTDGPDSHFNVSMQLALPDVLHLEES